MPPLLPHDQPSLAGRTRRILGWGLLTLVVLVIGGGVAENYRGHYLWKKYRGEWEAKGERFDLAAFVPEPVPADQNFAATPFFAPYLDYTIDETDREHPRHWKDKRTYERNIALATSLNGLRSKQKKSPDIGHWQLGASTDLRLWQECFDGNTNFPFAATPKDAATGVLSALHRYDDVLNELRGASTRPYSVFPVHQEEQFYAFLPHLASLRGLARIVHLRTVAYLESGHPVEALEDVQFGLRLADSLKSEGFLISQFARISMAEITLQAVWEGLARRRWNEIQIAELQSALARINFLEDYGRALRIERAESIHCIDLLRTGGYRDFAQSGDSGENAPADYSKVRYLPGGIFRQNQLTIARLHQERLIPLVDVEKHRVDVQGANMLNEIPELKRVHPYRFVASVLLPAVSKSAERFGRAQAGFDLAVVACALERHRLLTGQYPDTLDALTSPFLTKIPPDLITGQPLKYRRTEDGQFLLYSVGWNVTDDGGTVGLAPRRQTFDPRKGDWVWRYPAPSGEAAQ